MYYLLSYSIYYMHTFTYYFYYLYTEPLKLGRNDVVTIFYDYYLYYPRRIDKVLVLLSLLPYNCISLIVDGALCNMIVEIVEIVGFSIISISNHNTFNTTNANLNILSVLFPYYAETNRRQQNQNHSCINRNMD